MTLIKQYELAVERGEIVNDPSQRQVITHLQRVANELSSAESSWFKRGRRSNIQGLYLYGPVGGGKTFLMDLFYQHLPKQHKARFHFHHFMQQMDAQLRQLQGKKDPLQRIAMQFSKTTQLLCLDEFLVHDIADAMILAELLRALFARKVVLVATSNTSPDNLYLNGLQRARFLPAIDLIKAHCEVIALAENRDYRLGRDPQLQAYLYPLTTATQQALNYQFLAMAAGDEVREEVTLHVQNRSIPCVKLSAKAVWFQFNVICNVPRSQLDYLEIADRFNTVFVSDIPVLSSQDTARTILLIKFIDVMYDRGVHVIVSAAAPPGELYLQGRLRSAFQRTLSRLEEMQSMDYLSRGKQHQK